MEIEHVSYNTPRPRIPSFIKRYRAKVSVFMKSVRSEVVVCKVIPMYTISVRFNPMLIFHPYTCIDMGGNSGSCLNVVKSSYGGGRN